MNLNGNPSRWMIRRESDENTCRNLILPLGKGTRSFKISSALFARIYKEWDGAGKTRFAGDFAQALRELRAHNIDLGSMKYVSADGVATCYAWLEEYEAKMNQYAIETQDKVKKAARPQQPGEGVITNLNLKKPEPPKDEPTHGLYEELLKIAVAEYIKLAGPMGDTREIARKAKGVALAAVEKE